MGKPTPIFKITVWTLTRADSTFSLFIRKRDKKCQKCFRWTDLDNSHYWRRDMYRTRFDPENCIALCRSCHNAWEVHQNPEYKAFMIRRLGQARYDALEKRARSSMKLRDAILQWMELSSTLK